MFHIFVVMMGRRLCFSYFALSGGLVAQPRSRGLKSVPLNLPAPRPQSSLFLTVAFAQKLQHGV